MTAVFTTEMVILLKHVIIIIIIIIIIIVVQYQYLLLVVVVVCIHTEEALLTDTLVGGQLYTYSRFYKTPFFSTLSTFQ